MIENMGKIVCEELGKIEVRLEKLEKSVGKSERKMVKSNEKKKVILK